MLDARTCRFVAGSQPGRFGKAPASGADAIVLDLEGAVAPQDKDRARDAVAGWLGAAAPANRSRAVVRIVPHDPAGLAYAASRIALASRTAGLATPVAGVTQQFGDEPRIHPQRIAPIHRAPRPTDAQLDQGALRVPTAEAALPGAARRSSTAAEADRPVVLQTRRLPTLGEG